MSQEQPFVSVILPCRNEAGHIEACLKSILAQEPPEGGFEVIVADGVSTDGTREYLDQLAAVNPQVRVLNNPGRIVSTGLNAALRGAHGQVIVRMDAHTVYAAITSGSVWLCYGRPARIMWADPCRPVR